MPKFVEKPSDCYITPRPFVVFLRVLLRSHCVIELFSDPRSHVALWADNARDIRPCSYSGSPGWDAYSERTWDDCVVTRDMARAGEFFGLRFEHGAPTAVFLNGPYSGRHPARTAELAHRLTRAGLDVVNLCPAALGSEYFARYVWPLDPVVAHMGRYGFEAGRTYDHHVAGVREKCNRHDIAAVATGSLEFKTRFSRVASRMLRVPLLTAHV